MPKYNVMVSYETMVDADDEYDAECQVVDCFDFGSCNYDTEEVNEDGSPIEDLMDVEFEDDDKVLITFRILVGDHHYFEYSWITHKFDRNATLEDLITEVYGIEEFVSIGKEGQQPYLMDNREHGVEVYHRQPLNEINYNALKLMGVLN